MNREMMSEGLERDERGKRDNEKRGIVNNDVNGIIKKKYSV